jgi:hypothetical protein
MEGVLPPEPIRAPLSHRVGTGLCTCILGYAGASCATGCPAVDGAICNGVGVCAVHPTLGLNVVVKRTVRAPPPPWLCALPSEFAVRYYMVGHAISTGQCSRQTQAVQMPYRVPYQIYLLWRHVETTGGRRTARPGTGAAPVGPMRMSGTGPGRRAPHALPGGRARSAGSGAPGPRCAAATAPAVTAYLVCPASTSFAPVVVDLR